jgi:2-dehydropantoate 2-reductase
MEIEVILGTPLKRAQAKGLSTPHLALSYSICSAANALIIEESKKPSRL